MHGEGAIAELVKQQLTKYNKLYNLNDERSELDCDNLIRPRRQAKLF
jgi:hypothetical protein